MAYEKTNPWRRIAAYLIDYLVIVAYFGLLTLTAFGLRAVGIQFPNAYTTFSEKAVGQLVVILVLTLPVMVYFAWFEASSWQGTVGKHVLNLHVVGTQKERISTRQSLVRSTVKIAPWEIAHTAIWHVPGQPFVSSPGVMNYVGLTIAYLLAFWWLGSLFLGNRRTPYDLLAGTRVVVNS